MFDLILKNGKIIDVKNCAITPPTDVGLSNGKIAAVGNLNAADAKNVIDCAGKFISPGFIDAHVHIESAMVTPKEFASAVLPHGTTACIADPHEIVNVGGAAALDAFLKMCEGACADIFTVVPSSVPATPFDTNGAGVFSADDMRRFADNPRVVGLGEVMCFPEVLRGDKSITGKIKLFKSKNKTIDGHTAGLDGGSVAAYAAAGIENDHECTSFDEAKLRLDNGMNVYLREGSAAHNLKDILKGFVNYNTEAKQNGNKPLSVDNLAICTDDKHLSTIARDGHVDYNVRLAVESGLTLAEAVKAASYNPSKFYRLDDRGSIEIGKIADLVIIENEFSPKVTAVIKNGAPVGGKSKTETTPSQKKKIISTLQNSVKYKNFSADDFVLPDAYTYIGIGLVNGQLLTNKTEFKRGEIKNTLATIERYGKNGNFALCPIDGYGVEGGAVATSVSHDSHNVVVVGDNPGDMAAAVNRLREIGGGYVITKNGETVGELRLDVGGLMSSESGKTVSAKIAELEETAKKMSINPEIDPFTTLSFTALPVIPFVRLLDTGLFDVLTQQFLN